MKNNQWLPNWRISWRQKAGAFYRVFLTAVFFHLTFTTLAAGLQVVPVHLPTVVAGLQPLGAMDRSQRLNLAISLPLRNQAALNDLLYQLYDPASPNYHHFLTPEEFTGRFGPSLEDYQAVIDFARANGLTVTAEHPNRLLVDVSGSATDIERVLHVKMQVYQHPTESRTFYAPDVEPSLDLAVPILGISGLNNYSLPRPHYRVKPLEQGQAVGPNAGSGPGGGYMGKDFRKAYVPDTTLDGSGQVVGLLQFDGYTASDITYYENLAGLPNVTLTNVLIDGASGNPSHTGGEVEVSLDIEMVISMATNVSKVVLYIAPNPSPFVDLLSRMATDNLAKQLSCSWYVPSGTAEPAAEQIWQEMAAQGQSFYNASGDNDAYTGLIDFPGDSTNITQVGGTTLTTSGAGGVWASETVWNWGGGIGSGGGVSTQYPIPWWQTNINMTASQGSKTMRNTPDVALTADNVYVRADGANYSVGGTSCAAPLWAGFTALVNEQAAATGEPAVGFINPAVDAIGSGPNYTSAFHDITTGNNTSPASPAKYYAVTGYDLCTGWGTPNGQKLINALANPEALQITPTTGFTSLGGVGGPFTVTAQSFALTNAGTNSLTWTLSNTSLWLNASVSGGTLARGGPATNVVIGLNSEASNLLVGTYGATVWFTNLNDHMGQGRQFTLAVLSPPAITQEPTNQAVLDGQTAVFTVATTGGQPLYYQWQYNSNNLADGGNISGSTTTNLTINNASVVNVGSYSVIVSNAASTIISSNALLTIIPSKPVITQQPADETVGVKGTARFIVAAIGTKPFAYQWSVNTTNITGATNATLTLTNVQFSQAGNYAVLITNIYGPTQSSNATLTVTPCDPAPLGMVSWWPGEGNADDIIGNNNGTSVGGVSYTNGEVGQAFVLDGSSGYVDVPASSSLDVGTGNGFTVEEWINPSDVSAQHPLTEWNHDSSTIEGVHLWISVGGIGALYANLMDTGNIGHTITSAAGIIQPNVYQHVALTYDKTTGTAQLYYNGVVVASSTLGVFTPKTTTDLLLGHRVNGNLYYQGAFDEVSVYNRALSSNEVAAIYVAGSTGKCFTPTGPTITVQPTSQTVMVGQRAAFSVSATGTQPLEYQWTFDTTNIAGATNTSLVINNVQLTNAGAYAVVVSNLVSSVLSSNAILTVNPAPTNCDPVSSGLVSWWPGEGNANDVAGSNSGITVGGVSYTNGEVGQAFVLDGSSGYVDVPASSSLDVGTGNGFTVEEWINPSDVSAQHPLTEWNHDSSTIEGVHLWISVGGIGALYANLMDTGNIGHTITSAAGIIQPNVYQHVALTYDKTTGTAQLYYNGVVVASSTLGVFTPKTTTDLLLGHRVNGNLYYQGAFDEVSVYNRALSSNEVEGIYLAGSGGKCFAPTGPVITTQPTNQTVMVGQRAAFSVSATGTQPLEYQWTFDTTNIAGATNASLVLGNVQFTNAGVYAVVVSNVMNSVLSSNAILTVNPVPTNCDPVPSGLVSWWPGEGNANDVIGTNNGTAVGGVSYTNGEVGQAFVLDGSSGYVDVPASGSLNVGTGNGFTVEEWINPRDVSAQHPLIEWNHDSSTIEGVHLWISVGGIGALYANLNDTGNVGHTINSAAGIIQPNVYQHVALTYDKTTGMAQLYYNGAVVASSTLGIFTPKTTTDLLLGHRVNGNLYYQGAFDEVSVYNRALTSSEVAAIYLAGSGGKCSTPRAPTISSQPTNQTVLVGQTAIFTVGASGTAPLSYQWTFNTTNLLGATNASLVINNVQFTNAGSYAVVVSNFINAVLSSNAILTVLAPPIIITQPTNQTLYVGSTASFGVTASGTLPLSYQWNVNQTNIANATNATLVLTNVQLNQAGDYSVLVTNLVNSILSSNALLTVNLPPVLGATPSGNYLLMFWPIKAPGFVLETTPTLSPASWVTVSNPPIQIGDEYLESIQMTGTNQFYRLQLGQ